MVESDCYCAFRKILMEANLACNDSKNYFSNVQYKLYFSVAFSWYKTFPLIFLVFSKIKLLNPNLNNYFWKLTWKNSINIFGFFIGILTSKQIVPTSLFSFQLMTSIKKICRNFYVTFLRNVFSNDVYIALGNTQNTENQKP